MVWVPIMTPCTYGTCFDTNFENTSLYELPDAVLLIHSSLANP